MALQFQTALRNTWLDAIETAVGTSPKLRISTGSAPADCAAADTGTLLVELSLPSDWLNAASAGAKTKNGTWSGTLSGGSASTPGHHRIKDTAGANVFLQGTCGIGSGDLSFDGTFTSGQTVTITTYTLTAPGA